MLPLFPPCLLARSRHTSQATHSSRLVRKLSRVGCLLLGLALAGVPVLPVAATHPHGGNAPLLAQAAPAELQNLLTQIDAAASRRDAAAVLQFYGQDFKNSDGLTRATLEKALAKFWQGYETLTYRTEINSWQASRGGFTVETTTTITGTRSAGGRRFQLTGTLKSRQQIAEQKVMNQEILAEQSTLRSGDTPPTVQLTLPAQVRAGEDYSLDAVVQEPLRDSLLLGAAMDEPVTGDAYLKNLPIELELLTSGGLFKLGKAPAQPGDRWISIALIRDSGITLMTQRLKVIR
jgi:hypothetical protein